MAETGNSWSMSPRFVLIASAGRTGTTYLERALSDGGVVVRQEPPPSRSIYMLSNIAATEVPVIASAMKHWALARYVRSRRRWLARMSGDVCVEINPFLSNLVPEILRSGLVPDAIIHIVREPVSWIQSMMQFGAYSWRRPLVPWLPFVYYRPRNIDDAEQLSFARRLAYEWVYRNEKIASACELSGNYALVRYEDLFRDERLQVEVLGQAFRDAGVGLDLKFLEHAPVVPANASRPRGMRTDIANEDLKAIRELTAPLACRLGYEQ